MFDVGKPLVLNLNITVSGTSDALFQGEEASQEEVIKLFPSVLKAKLNSLCQ